MLNISIKIGNNKEEVTLIGTLAAFERLKNKLKEGKDCYLLMFDEKQWSIEKDKKLAILAEQENNSQYRRLGLVELFPLGAEKLLKLREEFQIQTSQIQIPFKYP